MNSLLIVTGWLLCLPAIILGPVAKLLPINTNRPWIDGLLINTLRAYKKYNAQSWIRRMKSISKNPQITLQYLKILTNKENRQPHGQTELRVAELVQFHDVQTDHFHHRLRVLDYKRGKQPASDFGAIVVVGNTVHDGNHRLAAAREAGIETLIAYKWS